MNSESNNAAQSLGVPSDELRPTSELNAAQPVLVIERDGWLRGERNSMLLRPSDGKKCCLGFDCLRRGLSPESIGGVYTPEDLVAEGMSPALLGDLVERDQMRINGYRHHRLVEELMRVNDDISLTEGQRELKIADLFSELGIKVKFVGATPATASPKADNSTTVEQHGSTQP